MIQQKLVTSPGLTGTRAKFGSTNHVTRKSWLCVAHIKWICWQCKKIHTIILSFNLVHNAYSNTYFLPSFHCVRMGWGSSWLLSRGQVIFSYTWNQVGFLTYGFVWRIAYGSFCRSQCRACKKVSLSNFHVKHNSNLK